VVAVTTSFNTFEGQTFYVNPANQKEYDSSIATATGTVKANLQKMKAVPSAYWIDKYKLLTDVVRPPDYDNRMVKFAIKVCRLSVLAHLVVAIWGITGLKEGLEKRNTVNFDL